MHPARSSGTVSCIAIGVCLAFGFASSSCRAQSAVAKSDEAEPVVETKPVEATSVPLIVRIDRSYLSKFIRGDVDVHRPVDQYVLGAHAVGTSQTHGTLQAVLIPDSAEAAFDIHYNGATATKTRAVQGPAVIYSRTFTDFDSTRRVLFDPRLGFKVDGDATVHGNTRLTYDGFAASQNLGRRIIPRIAQRKAEQSREQARRIADRDNKRQVQETFEHDVEQAVRDANADSDLVRYVNRFFGEQTPLQAFAKSSTDCIQIGVGTQGEKYGPLTALPKRAQSAAIEVWVHPSILGDSMKSLPALAASQTTLSVLAQTDILSALSLSLTPENASIGVSIEGGWLVITLPDEEAATAVAEADARADIAQKSSR